MSRFLCLDFETTGVEVKTCEVGQTAIDCAPEVDGLPDLTQRETSMVYSQVSHMPLEASKVNKLTTEQLAEYPPFMGRVRAIVRAWTQPGTIGVTYNGVRFDVAVLARYAAAHGGLGEFVEDVEGEGACEKFERLLARSHVDVSRVWQVLRANNLEPPWHTFEHDRAHVLAGGQSWMKLRARVFGRDLAGAHAYYHGSDFDGAHDASADTRATLSTLREMIVAGHVTLERALEISSTPAPGDVDLEGRFKWRGDQAVLSFGQHEGTALEKVDRGYLLYMLKQDFHWNTKQVARDFLAGRYPERKYENESAL